MSDPIAFPSSTPALGLPLLIAGQAQKEFFVNQALCLLDALHDRAVTASQNAPPESPAEGSCYRITAPAGAAWSGRDDHIAVMIGGDWRFIAPREGTQVFDREAGHELVFRAGWKRPTAPVAPSGGTVVDLEARTAIGALIQALLTVGMIGPNTP